jgi:hypothetical protein
MTMAQLTSPHPADIASEAPTEELPSTAEIVYVGKRTPFGPAVSVQQGETGRPLSLDAGARGYSWGTAGSKPVELARGILLDATGHENLAERLCRAFTWEVVGLLPADYFRLGRNEVLAWVDDFRFDEGAYS